VVPLIQIVRTADSELYRPLDLTADFSKTQAYTHTNTLLRKKYF
jgi:hypothetical protein